MVTSADLTLTGRADGASVPASVVICTRDRGARVRDTVTSVLANDWPSFELIVIDQSDDSTTEQALAPLLGDKRIRYIHSETSGLSRSRNLGLREARHDVVVMTDDDCIVPRRFVRTMVEELTTAEPVSMVFADVVEPVSTDEHWTPTNEAHADYTVGDVRDWISNDGVNIGIGAAMAFRKSVVVGIGGFDEELGAGARYGSAEDTDIALRLLLRHHLIHRTTRTWVDHYGARTIDDTRHAMRGAMYGIAAASGKMIRLRQWEVVRYFLDVAWAMVMEVGFDEIRRGRLPPVAGRIHHLVAGLVAGLRHPANPATLVFRPMPGPEVSERAPDRLTIVVEPSDYVLRNAGDMAMMQVAMTRLADLFPDADIAVFSDVPDELSTPAPNVRAVDATGRRLWLHTPLVPDRAVPTRLRGRADRAGRWLRRRAPHLARLAVHLRLDADGRARVGDHLALLARADLVLATGMGGVTDVFPGYAFDLLETLEGARRAGGARTVMVGQGIGPIDDPVLSAYAARVLGEVDLIALREERASRPLLRRLGVDPRRIVTTGDDAIELASERTPAGLGNDLGVNLRISDYAAITDDVAAGLAATLREAVHVLGAEMRTVAISAVPGEEDRLAVRRALGDLVGGDADDEVGTSIEGAIESIARCRVVVTGSYHAALFALSMGVPAIGLAASRYYEDKFLGLAEQFGPGCDVVLLSGPTAGAELGDLVVAAWQRAPDMRPSLHAAAQRQVDLGHAVYERIRQLVDPPNGAATGSGCRSEVRT